MSPYGLTNYAQFITNLVKQLESQGNTLILSSDEVVFWENKAYMHNQFALKNISQPNTVIHKIIDSKEYAYSVNRKFLFSFIYRTDELFIYFIYNNQCVCWYIFYW